MAVDFTNLRAFVDGLEGGVDAVSNESARAESAAGADGWQWWLSPPYRNIAELENASWLPGRRTAHWPRMWRGCG